MTTVRFDDKIVRMFLFATLFWGLVGMSVGVLLALQLADWRFNFEIPWLTFGRLRPVHTNAVIFAFAGNAIFCGVYYSSQRLLKARLFSDLVSRIHFWGWQLIIVLAACSFVMGITTGKEYAELEWPLDLMVAVIWLLFAFNFFATLARRREKHIYVALWFYIGTIITITVLHVVNSLAIPVSLTKSYPIYAGVQDALVQWWYGHNAVGFFLTTPFLGLMYYFVPKAAERPIYSYRLSIMHFWALVFLYIWAGPHHLHYTALPDWAQSLGMVFSVMLLAPSWGGMINGLLTLRGAWDRLRVDPVLKFFAAAITFYGMSTFEGPLMAIKSVNALSHYTDWTVGHVHNGALGWVALLIFGMVYWLVPRMWNTKLHSIALANAHFWLAMVGILFYIVSMWAAGITQGLMWKEFTADGLLAYPSFLETVTKMHPYYLGRALGGVIFLAGLIMLIINLALTIRAGRFSEGEIQVPEPKPIEHKPSHWHAVLERKPFLMAILALVVITIGGIVEMMPTFLIKGNIPTIASVKPWSPLELEGRDIYVREGCYACHSQMVRPFRDELARYGEYSRPGEFIYDRPFQWGSKRTGPDLHRVGGRYSNLWHLRHLEDPRLTSPGSVMPSYAFLTSGVLDLGHITRKIQVMKDLGAPYSEEQVRHAGRDAKWQARGIADDLRRNGVDVAPDREIIALIAYLQRLGTDIKKGGPL
ncbi:MAG: cbb3-type cytochrome c oxidase subunit [Fibrobacteria bacterium]|jgi:cytochrome c oxidase cbb3-type subunit I/II|nr:cbb3-type cytochrome c oxidase subunit [Fibrobacteria bacterium]